MSGTSEGPRQGFHAHESIFLGGEWVPATGGAPFEVIDATTEEVMGRVPRASADDGDRAVQAARAARPPGRARPPPERRRVRPAAAGARKP
ncbi:MAG: aldehyde dehydrogenase family protein, partial [Myxococcota bacterium]